MDISTPAFLFPAISLLLLAYTNRFLVLAQLIRELNQRDNRELEVVVKRQITNLRSRLHLIRSMQTVGVLSFILCTLSMILHFFEQAQFGSIVFGLSLIALTLSLLISLYEVRISCKAIEIELELSLIHISSPRDGATSRMPSSA